MPEVSPDPPPSPPAGPAAALLDLVWGVEPQPEDVESLVRLFRWEDANG